MSSKQMMVRCPGAQPAGQAKLEDYCFRIATHGGATIVRKRGCRVYGVLWQCTTQHLAILDRYEGVRVGAYFRRYVTVQRPENTRIHALTYLGSRTYPGTGRANYMLTAVLPGAVTHGLPAHYIDELRSWLPAMAIGEKRRRYRGRKR